ncbi:MAG: hypothetical protein HY905_19575 [Deltaproteobacteria bacterium]|nr:hypothetical protein [Deltaproteobacteria bacterium]
MPRLKIAVEVGLWAVALCLLAVFGWILVLGWIFVDTSGCLNRIRPFHRPTVLVAKLPPYDSEFPGLEVPGWADPGPDDPTPGQSYQPSPDGSHVAYEPGASRDRDTYHTILVWDRQRRTSVTVISVGEADPGSGASHTVRWSRDSSALFISGAGTVNGDYRYPICLVFVLATEQLYELSTCKRPR